jgi:hypothetical protein
MSNTIVIEDINVLLKKIELADKSRAHCIEELVKLHGNEVYDIFGKHLVAAENSGIGGPVRGLRSLYCAHISQTAYALEKVKAHYNSK